MFLYFFYCLKNFYEKIYIYMYSAHLELSNGYPLYLFSKFLPYNNVIELFMITLF